MDGDWFGHTGLHCSASARMGGNTMWSFNLWERLNRIFITELEAREGRFREALKYVLRMCMDGNTMGVYLVNLCCFVLLLGKSGCGRDTV